MPIPVNNSFATATVVSSFPFTDSQQVDSAGVTYSVFYKITPNFDGLLGVWGFGDLITYIPGFTVWMADQATVWMELSAGSTERGKPITVPVINGETYYIEIWPNAGNPTPANVTVSILKFTNSLAQAGDFLSNREVDRNTEFPLTVLDGSVDNTVRQFYQVAPPATVRGSNGLPHGEIGAILNNGNFMYGDESFLQVRTFDKDFNVLNTSAVANLVGVGSSRGLQLFYVGKSGPNAVLEYSINGVPTGNSWGTLATFPIRLGVNSLGTILYYATSGASPIKRWNMTTNVGMSDLVAAFGAASVYDILVLEDDTVLVCYLSGTTVTVKHYDTSGTTLHTYAYGSTWRNLFRPPRIGYALDSPNSFWLSVSPASNFEQSIFKNTKISDGSLLSERVHLNYLFGVYIGTLTATPAGRYGGDKAFPVLLMPVSQTPPPPTTGTIIVIKVNNGGDSGDNFSFNATGLTPASFSLLGGQSQQYDNVPIGSGYAIEEISNPLYDTAYTVSNGSPINNISVAAEETVIVTVTNTLRPNQNSGIYKIVPGANKRNDTLWTDLALRTTEDVAIPEPFVETAKIGA